uniref:Armadillo-like helical domain-containing protein n=1 Tax=Acrobeloides nanus TaxID=290746 RepID=A0A914DVK7_9BILA
MPENFFYQRSNQFYVWFRLNELVEFQGKALVMVVILLYHKNNPSDNLALEKLAQLEDNVILIGFGHYINTWLANCNEMFNLFARGYADDIHNEVTKYHSPMSLNCLLFLYKTALNNKHFVVALTSPPKSEDDENPEANTKHTTFTSFLTYCSFVLASFETDLAKNRAKLCLLVLWSIVEEPYAQNVMNDVNMSTSVHLYKAPMLHRPASYGPNGPPTLIAESLFELLTEFNQAHLMLQFPFEHYHLSLSIIHRMLIYQKKYRIRMKKWRPLFNGLVSLLNYLAHHQTKLDAVKSLQLTYRVLIVVNFFITYGDTFLPDATAYDFLYYEISRQDNVFQRLNNIVETRLDSVNKLHDDKPMGMFGD